MGKGLFKPPKHKWIADIVTFESPTKARKAAKALVSYLSSGRKGKMKIGKTRALAIVRALNYASNRAEAASRNPKLKPATKRELREISKIYKNAAEKASRIYAKKYRQDKPPKTRKRKARKKGLL